MFDNIHAADIEFEDIYLFILQFAFLIIALIAIIYYFRSLYLMSAIGATSWSDISDHYVSIKKLKMASWS